MQVQSKLQRQRIRVGLLQQMNSSVGFKDARAYAEAWLSKNTATIDDIMSELNARALFDFDK